MTKRSQKKPAAPTNLTRQLDAAAIEAAWDEAVVDAYDEEEQLGGIMNAIENELPFPFAASASRCRVSGGVCANVDITL